MTRPLSFVVIRLSAIGDVMLATPVVRFLRHRFPDSVIHFVSKKEHLPLLHHNPFITSLHDVEEILSKDGPASLLAPDYLIDLQHSRRSRSLPIKSTRILRFKKENWKKFLLVHFKWNLYREVVPVPLRYFRSLHSLGMTDDGKGCDFFLTEEEKAEAEQRLRGANGKRLLSVCFGAKHFTKRYPTQLYAKSLSKLNPELCHVVLLGGQEDKALGEEIADQLRSLGFPDTSLSNFSGSLSLRQSAALLWASDHVLTGDTGLMHIASAFQRPMTVLFGSSVKEFGFLPFRTPFTLIENQALSCRPCSHIGRSSCPKGHFHCMTQLQVEPHHLDRLP